MKKTSIVLIILGLTLLFIFFRGDSKQIWKYIPGISDFPSTPESSEFARKNGLLLANYKPSQERVIINGESYLIEDSFCTYYFKTRFSNEINKRMYEFLVSIKNEKTGEYCESKYKNVFPNEYVVYHGKKYGFTNSIGVTGLKGKFLDLYFSAKKRPIPPDTITFEFKNFDKNTIINFVKEK